MQEFGLIFIIDDFIETVASGSIIDDDGAAYCININNKRKNLIPCNLKSLKAAKKRGERFVIWFNK